MQILILEKTPLVARDLSEIVGEAAARAQIHVADNIEDAGKLVARLGHIDLVLLGVPTCEAVKSGFFDQAKARIGRVVLTDETSARPASTPAPWFVVARPFSSRCIKDHVDAALNVGGDPC